MKIDFDFRLLDVSLELHALGTYLETMEKQIDLIAEDEKRNLEQAILNQNVTPDDPEWDIEQQYYEDRVDFLLPRFFRSPYLVSLYAVYEVSVMEIAKLIQKGQGQSISINDIRGKNFLDRASKYYKHILNFELCTNNLAWQQLKMLSEVRNAIAHTNGRIEMLQNNAKRNILEWEKKRVGIEIIWGYIVVDQNFVEKTFSMVRSSLEDLVERYKQWDTEHKAEG